MMFSRVALLEGLGYLSLLLGVGGLRWAEGVEGPDVLEEADEEREVEHELWRCGLSLFPSIALPLLPFTIFEPPGFLSESSSLMSRSSYLTDLDSLEPRPDLVLFCPSSLVHSSFPSAVLDDEVLLEGLLALGEAGLPLAALGGES